MKLLKIKLDKDKTKYVNHAIRRILEKYPRADSNSIFATLIKLGYRPSFGGIRAEMSSFNREKQILAQLGVK